MKTANAKSKPNEGKLLLDASGLIHGPNIMSAHVVDAPYVNILDRLLATAVAEGEISQQQVNAGVWGAFRQTNGSLFVCLCTTDGSNLVYGTTVPAGRWSRK